MDNFIYYTVACANPTATEAILNKYGYRVDGEPSVDELAHYLEQVVTDNGRPALMDILDAHPDKDVILQAFNGNAAPAKIQAAATEQAKKCGCGGCQGKTQAGSGYAHLLSQGNLFLFAGVLILAVAIITSKKD